MQSANAVAPPDLVLFRQLVEELTAFDNIDGNTLADNLLLLRREREVIGDIDSLLSAYAGLKLETAPADRTARCQALCEQVGLVELCRQVIYLFYVGAIHVNGHWKRCGWTQHESALIWQVLDTHAPMTRGPGGFGGWSEPSDSNDLHCGSRCWDG